MAGALLLVLAACTSIRSGDESAEESSALTVATTATSPASTTSTTQSATSSNVGPPTTTGPDETTAPETSPIDLPLPTNPGETAAALDEAERAVRDATRTPDERAAWGARQQQLYRVLASNEAWVDEVTASVDPQLRGAVEKNWSARVELDALLNQHTLSGTLPAWRVEPPLPAEELLGYYREAGERHGVPWEILAAINLIETRMGRINGISTAGAQGPMQFLPTTWAECCEGDPTNDRDAINGAAKYLIDRGAATNLDRAVWGYNNSDHYVAAVTTYAAVLAEDPEAYYGYHGWQVYFASTAGLALLPVGYEQPEPIDAAQWLAANPDQRLTVDS